MVHHDTARQSGFTLIEMLIAMLVMAFGMLTLAAVQVSLSRNADIAKQRGEAVRLAQERIERLRSFVGIASGAITWNNPSLDVETVTTNTSFTVIPSLGGTNTDAMRPVSVAVSWLDRTNAVQSIQISSVISKSDPSASGSVGNPLPPRASTRPPQDRHGSIPDSALSLPGGRSAYQLSPTAAIVFDDTSGSVIQECSTTVTRNTDLAAACNPIDAYAVSGHIGRTDPSIGWPTGLDVSAIVRDSAAAHPITCALEDARGGDAAAISGKQYLCVIPLVSPFRWSGTLRLAGLDPSADVKVCRYEFTQTTVTTNERNVQPYTDVDRSIDRQNYLIDNAAGAACPMSMTRPGVSRGVLHQDCRSVDPVRQANDCPAMTSL